MTSWKTDVSAGLVVLMASMLIADSANMPVTDPTAVSASQPNSVTLAGRPPDGGNLPCRDVPSPNAYAINSGWSTPMLLDPAPARGARGRGGVLFAPAFANDSPTFRAALSAYLGGAPVDYWDARLATPTLAELSQYDSVLTCGYSRYADPVGMGDVLADYVDAGGRVILGQFSYGGLQGRILTLGYCPVTVSANAPAVYAGDGTDCVHIQVDDYQAYFVDAATLRPGNLSDGTMSTGSLALAWRPDRRVYYSPGNWGSVFSGGDWARLTANMCLCDAGPWFGACCDPHTGTCMDNVELANCQPPRQFHYQQSCGTLNPPCGNPGACCDETTGICTEGVLKANCSGRFLAGGTCAELTPPCGTWRPSGFLYAPSSPDAPAFRADVGARMGGVPTAYFDTRAATPTLDYLMQFQCVMTFVDYAIADAEALGNVLADYVDQGGRVILGRWCYPSVNSIALKGRIIEPDYCPVHTSYAYQGGYYLRDGTDCIHSLVDVGTYCAFQLEYAWLRPGAASDGTMYAEPGPGEYPAEIWRPDRRVFYSPGNYGTYGGFGDWAQVTANMAVCGSGPLFGACCDPASGTCIDNVEYSNCQPPLQFQYQQSCAGLNPACGNPGACCDEATGFCTDGVREANCSGRFRPGVQCTELAPSCGDGFYCSHSVTLWDSGGDGWNGNTLDVYVEGVRVLDGVAFVAGSGPVTFYFQAGTFSPIHTVFHATGWWSNEPYYTIQDGLGNQLCVGYYGSDCSVVGNCDSCGDGVCSGRETCIDCPDDCGPCACLSQLPNQANAFFSDLACTHCGGGGRQVRADNFEVSPYRHVKSVRLWGGYYNQDTPSNPDSFTVTFRVDADGLPGTAVATFGPLSATTREQTGMLVFGVHEYVYTIDVSVDLPAGTYWLEVYNNTVGNPASWFWEAGTLHTLVGIPGNAISYSLPESWSTRAGEAAFEITCGAENPGDCDGDHDVDINDFDVFAVCMAGPDHWLNSGCMCAALDTDGDVDLRDFALLQTSFTGGPPLPAGACCLTDASCIMVTQHVCGLVLAGVYQGDGSDCSAPCPTGACCITQDGSCPLITEAECIAAGGTYQGNDVPCPTNPPCPYGRYSNTIVPMSSITTAGAGLQLADDLTLAGVGARDLVYLDLRVHGNGGGVFNVTVELYSDCPGNGGTPIPGATFTWNGAPDGGVCELVADPVDPPVTIPDTVWMVATFSTPQAGWVIAGPAEIGFTANLFGKNNPPWVCDWWFGGNPYAGLWANLRCVAAGGKSHGEATRLSITKVETGGADFGLRSSNSEMPEPTDGPAVLHEAQPARANTSPLNNPNWR